MTFCGGQQTPPTHRSPGAQQSLSHVARLAGQHPSRVHLPRGQHRPAQSTSPGAQHSPVFAFRHCSAGSQHLAPQACQGRQQPSFVHVSNNAQHVSPQQTVFVGQHVWALGSQHFRPGGQQKGSLPIVPQGRGGGQAGGGGGCPSRQQLGSLAGQQARQVVLPGRQVGLQQIGSEGGQQKAKSKGGPSPKPHTCRGAAHVGRPGDEMRRSPTQAARLPTM
jgi:hypothetical protein